jgi:hypothetical protein
MQNHTVNLSRSFDIAIGGHCIICVGYDNKRKVWIMRNSWGEDFGEDGYFYVPFSYPLIEPWRLKLLPVSVSENERIVQSVTRKTKIEDVKPVSFDGVVDYTAEFEKINLMNKHKMETSQAINKMTMMTYSSILYSLKSGVNVLNVIFILLIKLISYLIYHAGVGSSILMHYSGQGLSMAVNEVGKYDVGYVLNKEVNGLSLSSFQPYFYSNNVSDPDNAVIMSVNQPDFDTRQNVATIIIYYQEFFPRGNMLKTLGDEMYSSFRLKKTASFNFIFIDLKVLKDKPNYGFNWFYNHLLTQSTIPIVSSEFPLVGIIINSSGVRIDSFKFTVPYQATSQVYTDAVRKVLGYDSLLFNITNPRDFLGGWVVFKNLMSNTVLPQSNG